MDNGLSIRIRKTTGFPAKSEQGYLCSSDNNDDNNNDDDDSYDNDYDND